MEEMELEGKKVQAEKVSSNGRDLRFGGGSGCWNLDLGVVIVCLYLYRLYESPEECCYYCCLLLHLFCVTS